MVPDDQPSSPWRSEVWPSEWERIRARREIARMREVLAAKSRHPTALKPCHDQVDKQTATG